MQSVTPDHLSHRYRAGVEEYGELSVSLEAFRRGALDRLGATPPHRRNRALERLFLEDLLLVLALIERCDRAWRVYWDRFRDCCFHRIRRVVHRPDVAADLVDELAQKLLAESLDCYDATSPFKAWVSVVATRLAIDYRRRRRESLQTDVERDLDGVVTESRSLTPPGGTALADWEELLPTLIPGFRRWFGTLTRPDQTIVQQRFVFNVKQTRIAEYFQLSEQALSKRIARWARAATRRFAREHPGVLRRAGICSRRRVVFGRLLIARCVNWPDQDDTKEGER